MTLVLLTTVGLSGWMFSLKSQIRRVCLCVCQACWSELFNTSSHSLIIVLMCFFSVKVETDEKPIPKEKIKTGLYATLLRALPHLSHLKRHKSFLPRLLHSTSQHSLDLPTSLLMNKTSNLHWVVHLHLFLCMLSCCCTSPPTALNDFLSLGCQV